MVKNRALHLGLNQIKPNPATVTRLPRDIEQRYHVLPITEADGKVTVAMANPEDPEASQAVVSLLGNSVYLVHADMDVIDKLISEIYATNPAPQSRLLVWSSDPIIPENLNSFSDSLATILGSELSQSIILERDKAIFQKLEQQTAETRTDLLIYKINEIREQGRRTIGLVQNKLLDTLPISQLITTNPQWPLRKLLLIVRNESCDESAIQWTLKIARPTGACVTVLPITMPIPGVYRLGEKLEPNLVNLLSSETELGKKLRHISQLLVEGEIEGTLKLREEPAYWQIRWEVLEGDYDMLIMGREPRNLIMRTMIGELVKPLLSWIDRPLLITKSPPI